MKELPASVSARVHLIVRCPMLAFHTDNRIKIMYMLLQPAHLRKGARLAKYGGRSRDVQRNTLMVYKKEKIPEPNLTWQTRSERRAFNSRNMVGTTNPLLWTYFLALSLLVMEIPAPGEGLFIGSLWMVLKTYVVAIFFWTLKMLVKDRLDIVRARQKGVVDGGERVEPVIRTG